MVEELSIINQKGHWR